MYTNKIEKSRACVHLLIQFLVRVSEKEMVKSRDHKSHKAEKTPPTDAQNRPFKQQAQSRPTLPPAPPRQPTPHPNPIQVPHKHLQHYSAHANAHEDEVTPPSNC